MLLAKRKANIFEDPISIAQALRHKYADQFMAAFAVEISSFKGMKTFITYLGHPSDIPKGSLLSSKSYLNHCLQSGWDV